MEPVKAYICSLVIPTKNAGELFREVLKGLQAQSCWERVQFIVVDSGSADDTVRLAQDAGAMVQRIPPERFNHGATRDFGISLAASDNVVLMVQDAVPNDGILLERLVGALSEPGAAAAYARQIPRSSADVLTRRNLNGWLTGRIEREVRVMKDRSLYEAMSSLERYFFCNFDNVCSAIKKSVWQEIKFGGIAFGEDIDWAERVLKAGHSIVYEPGAAVIHSHDRPLLYEYKRTYLCHRKLYRQFGLRLVPSIRQALRAWVSASRVDMAYVNEHERDLYRRFSLMLRVPALNLLGALGQYYGAKDEMNGVFKKVEGV